MATITSTPNGPYKVEGATLTDSQGEPVGSKATMYLCRCGHSRNKPMCDGAHTKNGFQAE